MYFLTVLGGNNSIGHTCFFKICINLLICINSLIPLECQGALGMENGGILDGQISASSQWDANHAAIQGRLFFQAAGAKQGGWSAGNNNPKEWLQIDLGSQYTKVTGVSTQGRNNHPQWVTSYKLQYSNDGLNFQYYREQGQTANKVK